MVLIENGIKSDAIKVTAAFSKRIVSCCRSNTPNSTSRYPATAIRPKRLKPGVLKNGTSNANAKLTPVNSLCLWHSVQRS